MAIRNVLKIGESILREKAREVTVFDEKLSALIDDLFDTMVKADGVGLAAPQVGVLRRVCVICPDYKTRYELVNPVIISQGGSQTRTEGCLSIPGRHAQVTRPQKITVRYFDRKGNECTIEAIDFLADIFCHEIDHLDGILYVDKITTVMEGDA